MTENFIDDFDPDFGDLGSDDLDIKVSRVRFGDVLRHETSGSELQINLAAVSDADDEEWIPFSEYVRKEVADAIEEETEESRRDARDNPAADDYDLF